MDLPPLLKRALPGPALAVNLLCLMLLFYNSPIELRPALRPSAESMPAMTAGNPPARLVESEHRKAVEEIQARINHGNEWFRLKFVLIGGLLAAFLSALGIRAAREKEGVTVESSEETLAQLFRSNATATILAVAAAVALLIDMHNRQSDAVVRQLGLWIAHHVEPAMLGPQHGGSAPAFLGWEQFLRVSTGQPGGGVALHSDPFFTPLFLSYGHYSTWALILLYLGVLGRLDFSRRDPFQRTIAVCGFTGLHLLVGGFAVLSNTAPAMFERRILGFSLAANWAWLPFLLPWAVMFAFNWRHFRSLRGQP